MIINGSPNITNFDFSANIDISTTTPSTNLVDFSTYIASGFQGIIFNLTSPSGLLFHQGDFTAPDITVEGGSVNIAQLPVLGNIIEFGTYKIEAFVKDQDGNIYKWTDGTYDYKKIEVCKPNTLDGATGFFGGMDLEVITDCTNNRICFTDLTPKLYKGISGDLPYTTELKIIYPPDPVTFVQGATQTTTLLPSCYTITQNGRYQFRASRVVTYQLGGDTSITVKYQFVDDDYKVQCNVQICGLLCDYAKLIQKFDDARCAGNVEVLADLQPKITIINSKLIEFDQNIKCGIDVTGIVEEIAEIGGFDCGDCFPSQILPNPLIVNNGVWSLVIPCGDITGSVLQEGNNVQLTLQDKTTFISFDAASQAYLSVNRVVSDCSVNMVITLDLSSITDDLCKVKTSAFDECCEYLSDKLISSDGSVIITEVDSDTSPDDGCKKIDLSAPSNTPLDWVNLSAGVGWTVSGRFQYSKDGIGNVRLRGILVGNGTVGTHTLGTLPVGFRPTIDELLTVSYQQILGVANKCIQLSVIAATGAISVYFDTSITNAVVSVNSEFNIN